jgi:hypothetical protein
VTVRRAPMSLAAKRHLEATLHGVVIDLMACQNQVRFAWGAQFGDRVRRLTWRAQALLTESEQCDPDTSTREVPP